MIETVIQVKNDLIAKKIDLSGPCGAFAITSRVAWLLRNEGAGLLEKSSGNNCNGYATDIICYPDGHIFDILSDSGGSNEPTWNDAGIVSAIRYRIAFDPEPVPPIIIPPVIIPPVITFPPASPQVDLLTASIEALAARLDLLIAHGLKIHFG